MKKIAFLLVAGCMTVGAYAEITYYPESAVVCEEGTCQNIPKTGGPNLGPCEGATPPKTAGTECNGGVQHSKSAMCVNLKYKKTSTDTTLTDGVGCDATECDAGYALWFDKGFIGNCYSDEWLKNKCSAGDANCGEGCKCEPEILTDASNLGDKKHKGRVFTGCVCKDKGGNIVEPLNPVGEYCDYEFKGEYRCPNGSVIKSGKKLRLSKSEFNIANCENFQSLYEKDVTNLKNLADKLCASVGGTVANVDATTQNAINNITALIDGKRTVWRTAEGKFNTARLASDATAGVVLGTVGGIVSGKVIKKKQLEKGFDALHCTVGGQNMADYGDTFRVSFQR